MGGQIGCPVSPKYGRPLNQLLPTITRLRQSALAPAGRFPVNEDFEPAEWFDLMPISHGASRMYRIIRSLTNVSENGSKVTPHLTMDRMCWLMSSFSAKAVGEQTIRDYRNELVRHGMVRILRGEIRTESPRYEVFDLPPVGRESWSSAHHVNDAYVPHWRTQRPSPSDAAPIAGFEDSLTDSPGIVYIVQSDLHNALKIGITSNRGRLEDHTRLGWEESFYLRTQTRLRASLIERRVLRQLRTVMDIPPCLTEKQMPQGGWSETASMDCISEGDLIRLTMHTANLLAGDVSA